MHIDGQAQIDAIRESLVESGLTAITTSNSIRARVIFTSSYLRSASLDPGQFLKVVNAMKPLIHLFFLMSLTAPLSAQEIGVRTAADLNCLTSAPAFASITDLRTGLGTGRLSVDSQNDEVPPCVGNALPSTPTIGEWPLDNPIPQLVKIKSSGGQCSGALISNNAVITAAHCVMDRSAKKFFRDFEITPGYQKGGTEFGRYTGVSALTFSRYTAEGSAAHDIAVIKLGGASLPEKYSYYGMTPYNANLCAQDSIPLKELFRTSLQSRHRKQRSSNNIC